MKLDIQLLDAGDIPGTLDVQVQGISLGRLFRITDEEPDLVAHKGKWVWELPVIPAHEHANGYLSSADEGLSFPNQLTAAFNLLERISHKRDISVGPPPGWPEEYQED